MNAGLDAHRWVTGPDVKLDQATQQVDMMFRLAETLRVAGFLSPEAYAAALKNRNFEEALRAERLDGAAAVNLALRRFLAKNEVDEAVIEGATDMVLVALGLQELANPPRADNVHG